MSSPDLLVLGLAAAIFLALAVAAVVSRRERAGASRRRPGGAAIHPALAAGLSEVVAGDLEPAIAHLRQVVHENTDAIEVYVLLGDLHRRTGQVERALRIHRSVLNRRDLTDDQRLAALIGIARDHEAAGFPDRALASFEDVAARAPDRAEPLRHLRRLSERTGDWDAALAAQQRLLRHPGATPRDELVLGFLQDRVGRRCFEAGDVRPARRHFEKALEANPKCVPAWLHLGDLHYAAGRVKDARRAWLGLTEADPARAWLAYERLDGLRRSGADDAGLEDLLRRRVDGTPGDWRARAFLAARMLETGRPDEARHLVGEALRLAPTAAAVQRLAWRLAAEHGVSTEEARERADLLGDGRAFSETFTCRHCRYRTDEPDWRCPHCHRWDAFAPDIA